MLLPYNWLKEYVDTGLAPEELAEALTMSGLEVEGVHQRHAGLAQVITCRITGVAPHPNADKLTLVTVDKGGEEQTVVCGAPNVAVGLVTALALPGAVMAGGMEVGEAKIRGVKSAGMLCSLKEMGISDDHSGIAELDPALPLGVPVTEALNLETKVLEVSVTPNRGDALSVLGVARDAAAITGSRVTLPKVEYPEHQPGIEGQAAVEILAPEDCPRYTALLVKGVKTAPSPLWMADRLSAAGIRPISNVVDVTNYVLMELGQPLHAFDYHDLADHRVVVRPAQAGEKFTTLDGQERVLEEGMLLICDGEKPVGLAGVMGGLNSEIEDDTEDVLIESAFFNPLSIRRTSKRLGLSTEASYRFERAIDQENCLFACRRAAQLMAQLAEGKVAAGFIDAHPLPWQPKPITISAARTARFIGMELTPEQVAAPLRGLGLEVSQGEDPDRITVTPTPARTDLERPVDLAEEVARVVGYNQVPTTSPVADIDSKPRRWLERTRARARDLMCALGFDEAINYSFGHPEHVAMLKFRPGDPRNNQVKLLNPLSEDMSMLRTSLLPGLLTSVRRNLSHRVPDVALFEVGRVFWERRGESLPTEPHHLAGVLSGLAQPASWWAGEKPAAFTHIKGAVEYLLNGLGITGAEYARPQEAAPYLDPDECLAVLIDGEPAGEMGLITAKVAKAFDLDAKVYFFNLDFGLVAEKAPRGRRMTPLPRFPEVVRDLAIVVDRSVEAGALLAQARAKGGKWLKSVVLFDIYTGKPLPKSKKSLGLRLYYRDEERTLIEAEVVPDYDALVNHLLAEFQGELRT